MSPSSIWSPTAHSIFHTVPVMCASTCRHSRTSRRPDRRSSLTAGTIAFAHDVPAMLTVGPGARRPPSDGSSNLRNRRRLQRGGSDRRHARGAHLGVPRGTPAGSPTTARPMPPPSIAAEMRGSGRPQRADARQGRGRHARRARGARHARALRVEHEAVFVLCDGDLGASAGALRAARRRRRRRPRRSRRGRLQPARRRRHRARTRLRPLGDPPSLRPADRDAPISGQRALSARRARRRAALRARLRHGDRDDDRRRSSRAPADGDRARSRSPRDRAHRRRLRRTAAASCSTSCAVYAGGAGRLARR